MNKISFVFNDVITTIDFSLGEYSPTNTLLEFIRSKENRKGTKEGCNEGDCGACTVILIELINQKIKFRAINSCVIFLPAIHGKQILTIEDVGKEENLNPVQELFIKHHASQCGFCTPGFIMSLLAQKIDKPNSSKEELIEAITGNLCRCTGYRPIVDATTEISNLPELTIPKGLIRTDLLNQIQKAEPINIETAENKYLLPFTFSDALKMKFKNSDAVITSGGTDLVLTVTKRKEKLPKVIDISAIEEIQYIKEKDNKLEIGAGTKIEDIYQYSKNNFSALSEILSVFGAKQIRNRATIGGNLATASPIGDILPVLYAYNANIILSSSEKERKVNINDFIIGYRKTVLSSNELIKAVEIPFVAENQIVKSYKISKRFNLDISTVSAGFSIIKNDKLVENIVLCYGGMAEKPKRAVETEKFLIGKELNYENIEKAVIILEKEFKPLTDARSSNEARTIMAKNLLIKFFQEI